MTDTTWTTAEKTLRDHFAARSTELIELTPKHDVTLGVAFWVRYAAGGGGLVMVRGDEIIAEPTPASVDRYIELDGLARGPGAVQPKDFLTLLTVWNALPELGSMPMRDGALGPKWVQDGGSTAFVLHASRKTNAGARRQPMIAVRRATGTLGPKGITWALEDTEVPVPK